MTPEEQYYAIHGQHKRGPKPGSAHPEKIEVRLTTEQRARATEIAEGMGVPLSTWVRIMIQRTLHYIDGEP